MARKSESRGRELSGVISTGKDGVAWKNITLEPDDIEAIISGSNDLPAIADALALLLLGNGDFTLKYDHDKREYAAFAISAGAGTGGVRTGISARAQSGLLAASACFYKIMLWQSNPDRFSSNGENLGIR